MRNDERYVKKRGDGGDSRTDVVARWRSALTGRTRGISRLILDADLATGPAVDDATGAGGARAARDVYKMRRSMHRPFACQIRRGMLTMLHRIKVIPYLHYPRMLFLVLS